MFDKPITVSEMIELLKKQPQNAVIYVEHPDADSNQPYEGDIVGIELYDKKDNAILLACNWW